MDKKAEDLEKQLEECEKKAKDIQRILEECKGDLDTSEVMEFIKLLNSPPSKVRSYIHSCQKKSQNFEGYKLEIVTMQTLLKDYEKRVKEMLRQLEEYKEREDIQTLSEKYEEKVMNMQILINKYEERALDIKSQISNLLLEDILKTILGDREYKKMKPTITMLEEYNRYMK